MSQLCGPGTIFKLKTSEVVGLGNASDHAHESPQVFNTVKITMKITNENEN